MTRDIQRKETRWEREQSSAKEMNNMIEELNCVEKMFLNMTDEQYDEYYVRRNVYKCSPQEALVNALVF